MFSRGINVSHAIKSQEAFKVVWRKSDESGTGWDEAGAIGTNRAEARKNPAPQMCQRRARAKRRHGGRGVVGERTQISPSEPKGNAVEGGER